jgi:hypothetical protein
MKATSNGKLNIIPECYINVPGFGKPIQMRSLPDISDSKQTSYNAENIMGRSVPMYTYSHSGDRTLSIQIHLFIIERNDAANNLNILRQIQSAAYPRQATDSSGAPYIPPTVCTIKCGQLLASEPICAILQSYNVKFPTEVAWWEEGDIYCPYRFDIDTNWLVVYTSSDLPYADRIYNTGR